MASKLRSRFEAWFLRMTRDIFVAQWPHGLKDRLRMIEGEQRQIRRELIALGIVLRRLKKELEGK